MVISMLYTLSQLCIITKTHRLDSKSRKCRAADRPWCGTSNSLVVSNSCTPRECRLKGALLLFLMPSETLAGDDVAAIAVNALRKSHQTALTQLRCSRLAQGQV